MLLWEPETREWQPATWLIIGSRGKGGLKFKIDRVGSRTCFFLVVVFCFVLDSPLP